MWKSISEEEISNHFDEELSIPLNSKFDDILDYIDDVYPYIKNEYGVSKAIQHLEKPSDWTNFDTSFIFSHRKIIPPRHNLRCEFTSEDQDESIYISYEYYFDYKAKLVINKNDALEQIFRLIKSIYITQASYEWMAKKRSGLKRIPIFGELLYDIRYSKYLSTADASFSILEVKSTQIVHEFQDWLESRMDDTQLLELSESFDKYWEGVPTERRGMRVQM